MADSSVSGALTAAGDIYSLINAAQAGSLVEYTRLTRVEPVTLVDLTIRNASFMPDVMQTMCSLFTAYYMQAISLSMNVGDINVVKILDAVNPNRSIAAASSPIIGHLVIDKQSLGIEAPNITPDDLYQRGGVYGIGKSPADMSFKDPNKIVQEVANLAVGKLVDVRLESKGCKAVFPVQIRLQTVGIDVDNLTRTLSIGNRDISMKERFHAWRSGEISMLRDLILCQDLIDEHRKNLMNDAVGIYKESIARNNRNVLAAVLSGAPSISTASNLVVMSPDTVRGIEKNVNGRLSDFHVREKVFKETYVMIMAIVYPMDEMVEIYTRSIPQSMLLSKEDIKAARKSSDVDLMKIFQAYASGSSPSL